MDAAEIYWWLLPGSALLSAALTFACLVYAHSSGLVDQPGRRRSHVVATPRGGGLAIVIAALAALACLALLGALDSQRVIPIFGALGAVAAVGFWDDHRSLAALPRIVVHVAASFLVAWTFLPVAGAWSEVAVLLAIALVLSTVLNFWNFMDGINGIASVHAAWLAGLVGLVMVAQGNAEAGLWSLALGAAILGFLPFNLPHARIFLGDVGSGFLGLAVGVLLLWAWGHGNLGLPALVILPSAFMIDAGATLSLRMAAGRRWYTPHRSHLYQWLARRGRSHSRIVLMSLAWNLPTSAVALTLGRREDAFAFAVATLVYAAGLAVWWGMRRRLLREAAGLV